MARKSKLRGAGLDEAHPAGGSAIVPLRAAGAKPPLFLIHGVDGSLEPFQDLVRHLEPDQPVYGVLSQALLGERFALTRIEELAAYYIQAILALEPRGPYDLLGFSFGGLVAFEMAQQLHARGEQSGMLGMLDNLRMGPRTNSEGPAPLQSIQGQRWKLAAYHATQVFSPRGLRYAKAKLAERSLRNIYTVLAACRRPIPRFLQRPYDINWFAAANYAPQFFPGRVTLFRASASANDTRAPKDLWAQLADGGVELKWVPGGHEDILREPNVILLAQAVTDCLANLRRPARTMKA